MEWVVKITGKPKQRIKIKFDPQKELIYFIGQYKASAKDLVKNDLTNGFIWYNFSEEQCSMITTLEEISRLMIKICGEMEKRVSVHEDLSRTFNAFVEIEIPEEDKVGGLMI